MVAASVDQLARPMRTVVPTGKQSTVGREAGVASPEMLTDRAAPTTRAKGAAPADVPDRRPANPIPSWPLLTR